MRRPEAPADFRRSSLSGAGGQEPGGVASRTRWCLRAASEARSAGNGDWSSILTVGRLCATS
eukprot:5832209-Alexandrium_andersonii.AAC.1